MTDGVVEIKSAYEIACEKFDNRFEGVHVGYDGEFIDPLIVLGEAYLTDANNGLGSSAKPELIKRTLPIMKKQLETQVEEGLFGEDFDGLHLHDSLDYLKNVSREIARVSFRLAEITGGAEVIQ